MSVRDEFTGVIGRDWRDSTPAWPERATAPAGAPNVLLIVLDDVGFAQLGCYGSDIATPEHRRAGGAGLRLAELPHHRAVLADPVVPADRAQPPLATAWAASPTSPSGYPGLLRARSRRENGFLSEILARARLRDLRGRQVAPHARRRDAHGRRPRAAGRSVAGFDRWYGFHGGETHQFVPSLYHDNHSVRPPRTVAEGYHLSDDLADRAIEFLGDLRAVDAEQPFFLYFATGACHSPHHAPPEWIERYRGQFDDGWDAWRERDVRPPASRRACCPRAPSCRRDRRGCRRGTTLAPEDQAVAARFMECFAAFLSYTDAQIGRLLDVSSRRPATSTTRS